MSISAEEKVCYLREAAIVLAKEGFQLDEVHIKNKAGAIMLRPTNAGAATSALFEMKKGTAFLVRQDQQNNAQIFVILF